MPEPDKLPEWASDDVVDPSSGQPNVSEPPEGRKDSGWNRREIPPRQWFNWLHRYVYRWIVWLRDKSVPKTLTGSTTNTADDTGHTHNITVATQPQAEAGTNTTGLMTAQRTKQAVDAYGFIAENNLQEIEDAGATDQAEARGHLDAQEDLNNRLEVFSGSAASVDLSALPGGYPGDGIYLVRAGTNFFGMIYVSSSFDTGNAYLLGSGGTNTVNEIQSDNAVLTANLRNIDTSSTSSQNIVQVFKVGQS